MLLDRTTQVVHRFAVTTGASLASAITSFGAGQQRLIEPDPQASTPKTGEQTPPDWAVTATEQRGSPASHPAQTLDTSHTLYQGNNDEYS